MQRMTKDNGSYKTVTKRESAQLRNAASATVNSFYRIKEQNINHPVNQTQPPG